MIAPSTLDAVVFVGYRAREGAAEAVRAHTDNGRVVVKLNGVEVPEAGSCDSKKQRPPMPEVVIPSEPHCSG